METVTLDKDFFQDVLRKYEKDNSIIVDKIDVKPAVPKGNNFASIVSRAVIKGFKVENNNEKSDYDISLIIKQLVRNKALLDMFHFDIVFANESESYNIIIPTLVTCTPNGRLNMAQCLLATKEVIVLKDLNQDGYTNIDKRMDFKIEETKLTLTELAKLHAASFVLRHQNPGKLDHLGTLTQETIFNNNNEAIITFQRTTFDLAIYIFKELVSTSLNQKAIKLLEDLRESSIERQTKLFTDNRKYKVINHGDAWGNNILLKDDSVVLIDLQIMRYASVAADLSYFLYINMHPETRRQNYNALLQHYLNVVHRQTLACGVDMSAKLTIDWLRGEMNDFAIFGMISALWILPIFHYDMSDMNMDEFKEDEWNSLDWHISKITDGFKQRVVELVLDYIQHNMD